MSTDHSVSDSYGNEDRANISTTFNEVDQASKMLQYEALLDDRYDQGVAFLARCGGFGDRSLNRDALDLKVTALDHLLDEHGRSSTCVDTRK